MGQDAPVIISPVVAIERVAQAVPLDGIEALIFTSENAVIAVAGAGHGLPAWCVGDRTALAASEAGYNAKSAGGSAEDLTNAIIASKARGRLLHLRGQEAHGDVAATLQAAGIACDEVILYRQVAQPLSQRALDILAQPEPVLLPLFSPNSARHLAEAMRGQDISAALFIAAMSRNVALAWNGVAPARVQTAKHPDATAMLSALKALAITAMAP